MNPSPDDLIKQIKILRQLRKEISEIANKKLELLNEIQYVMNWLNSVDVEKEDLINLDYITNTMDRCEVHIGVITVELSEIVKQEDELDAILLRLN